MPFQLQPVLIALVGPAGSGQQLLTAGAVLTATSVPPGTIVMVAPTTAQPGTAGSNQQPSILQQWVAVAQITGDMSGIGFVNPASGLIVTFNGSNNPLVLEPYVLASGALDIWAVGVAAQAGSSGWTTVWPLGFTTPDGTLSWSTTPVTGGAPAAPQAVLASNTGPAASWQFLQLAQAKFGGGS